MYMLKKPLYGLKQVAWTWYNRFEAYIESWFFEVSYEHTLLVKIVDKGKIIIVYMYVDDLIFTGNCDAMFEEFKKSMMDEFEMSDLGVMHCFLSVKVVQFYNDIFISQKKYVGEI